MPRKIEQGASISFIAKYSQSEYNGTKVHSVYARKPTCDILLRSHCVVLRLKFNVNYLIGPNQRGQTPVRKESVWYDP